MNVVTPVMKELRNNVTRIPITVALTPPSGSDQRIDTVDKLRTRIHGVSGQCNTLHKTHSIERVVTDGEALAGTSEQDLLVRHETR